MYRLLRRYTLPVHNRQLATVQNKLQQTSRVCSFCSFYHFKEIQSRPCLLTYQNDVLPDSSSYGNFRFRSTSTSEAFLDKREPKKIKHKMRKYAELLEVSEETTTDTKATIKKLNAASVSTFANQPEISLDQLHKIRKPKKKPNREISDIDNVKPIQQAESGTCTVFDQEMMAPFSSYNAENETSLPEDEISIQEDPMVLGSTDQTAMIKNASLFNSLEDYDKDTMDEGSLDSLAALKTANMRNAEKRSSKAILKAKRKDEAAKVNNEELERLGKQESLKRSLHSYLDVCVNCGMISQAFSTIVYYRNRGKRIRCLPKVMDVALYNTVLHGFAASGNLGKIKEVLQIIAEDSIKPDPQTYAAVFECVGRMPFYDQEPERGFLEIVLSEMTEHGISLNDVIDKSMFLYDQRESVESGIRVLEPDFKVIYTPPNTKYTNHLLEKISTTVSKSVSPANGLFTTSELREIGRRQMELESQGQITVKSIAAHAEPTPLVLHCRAKVLETEEMWKKVISDAFRRDLAALKIQYSNGSHLQRSINIYPYLKVLDEHHYVNAISNEIRQLATGSETFSPSLNFLTRQLGLKIFQRYQIEMKKKNGVREKISGTYEKYCDRYLNEYNGTNTRSMWQNLLYEERHRGPTADIEITQWPATLLASVGRFLYNILMRDIKIDINSLKMNSKTQRYLPAFYAVFRNNRQMLTQEVKPHPILSRVYEDARLETLVFEPAQLPSISPPVPWYTIRNGGYLISDAKIIRLSYQAVQQWKRLENVPEPQLYPVLDSLNQLGSIPWKINNPVLAIALKIFQDGGAKNLDIPEPPTHTPTPMLIDVHASKEERNKAAKARLKEKRKKADMYSLWCEILYRLSLANHFKKDVFWLPHSMDFRGRVYPIPPHVNHLGSDLARSLMVFALGKPLGPDGLDWLKIHIINLTGLKKRESNSDRLKYANELLPKILDSAERPLDGEKWWQESEEPWQTLAACFEIAEAMKSPNPSEYVSQFPVHQDGSCNGLQHYAALGRDRQGAESVNLSPSPKPQDVYSAIAALVEKERQRDADKDVKIAQVLDGIIKRKVIKQTVMTTVYGVTRFGARLQIARQLKEIDFPEEYLWQGSHYLVNKTFHSLREIFTSTKLIQDWLTDCARLVALVCAQNMEWVTPLGLPVVQPYNKSPQSMSGTKLSKHFAMDMYERPNVMKQKNAFPPNFIHSLDSCHMMLTSLHCEHAGLTFVSVHDCFWTHACTVPAMNKICREEFVALHSEPILKNLSKFLSERFSYQESELIDDGSMTELTKLKLNNILKQVPKQGDFDLQSVLNSVYFFS